jgi:putative membrane protein
MYSAAIMAFLHHVAAFATVSALAVEIAIFKPPLTVPQARRLRSTDNLFGAAAGVVLVIGMLRVAYFEKGPAYYWHDGYFLAKFGAFVITALISIYPTVIFISWAKTLKAGTAPEIPAGQVRRVRLCLMLEATGIVVILLCAAFMARGFGFLRQ